MVIRIRLSGAVISRKIVISIGSGVWKVNDPNTLCEFGGHTTLTDIGSEISYNQWTGPNANGLMERLNFFPNF